MVDLVCHPSRPHWKASSFWLSNCVAKGMVTSWQNWQSSSPNWIAPLHQLAVVLFPQTHLWTQPGCPSAVDFATAWLFNSTSWSRININIIYIYIYKSTRKEVLLTGLQQVSLQQSTYGCDVRSASSTTSASRASSRIRQELTCTACSSSLERAARISVRKRWVVACTRKHMLPPLCSGTWQQNLKTMYFIDAFLEAWPCHKVPLNPSFVAPTVFGTLLQLHDLRSQRDNFGSNASSGSSSIVPRGTWAWRAEKTPFSVCCLEFRRGSKPSTHMTLKKK